MKSRLQEWEKRFKGKKVQITEGEYADKQGTIKAIVGYWNTEGCIVEIYVVGVKEPKRFTSRSFEFINQTDQDEWDRDD